MALVLSTLVICSLTQILPLFLFMACWLQAPHVHLFAHVMILTEHANVECIWHCWAFQMFSYRLATMGGSYRGREERVCCGQEQVTAGLAVWRELGPQKAHSIHGPISFSILFWYKHLILAVRFASTLLSKHLRVKIIVVNAWLSWDCQFKFQGRSPARDLKTWTLANFSYGWWLVETRVSLTKPHVILYTKRE